MSSTRPGLGRIHVPDERDARYPMRTVIEEARQTTAPRKRTTRTWAPRAKPVLDQGQTPTCVGHAFTHWYTDGPVTHPHPMPYGPIGLYDRAQLIDGIHGHHDGTTGRAAASVLKTAGIISAYHNAQTFDDVVECLLYVGPVCIGTNWLEDMFTPGADHYLPVSGNVAGGHEYVLDAIDTRAGWIEMKNSWGYSFGRRGFARFHISDLRDLWADGGDAIIATETRGVAASA